MASISSCRCSISQKQLCLAPQNTISAQSQQNKLRQIKFQAGGWLGLGQSGDKLFVEDILIEVINIHMKVYLLVLVLTLGLCGAFRVLSRDSFDLGQVPDSISYLGPHLLVVQVGSNISVYDTQTHQVVQTFQSDQESPDVQVAPQSNMVLFRNNNSIFQMGQASTPTTRSFPTQRVNWVYGLGNSGNAIMVHELSDDGTQRFLRYLYTNSSSSSTFTQLNSQNNTAVAGSRVVALSPEEYYFASGGVCHNEAGEAFYYFYQGSSKGIQKIYDLKVPGCVYNIDPNHKQEWLLSTIDTGNFNRLHAVTYVLDELNQPRVFTTQVLTSNSGFISELARFDTKRLIGVDFLNGNLYTADDLLCRVVEHFPEYYNAAVPSESVLNFDMTSSVVSQDESMVLALTGTDKSYLLSVQDSGYSIDQTLTSPSGQATNQAFFSNSTLLILLDSAQNLSIYNTEDQQWYESGWMGVEDFCVTSSNLIFSVTHPNASYVLTVSRVVSNGTSFDIETINTLTLNWTFSDVMCLDSNSVLVNPTNPDEPIAIWKYNNAFVNTANLIKLAKVHSLAHTTGSAIYFTNPDNHSTPLFYDFTLSPIVLSNGLLLPPMATYSLINTGSEYILMGVGDDPSSPISIDQYQLFSNYLFYMGSYPLISNGTGALSKVIILPTSDKISIEYPSSSSRRTLTFNLTSPPQQLRGHFYDAPELDCTGYTNGLFRMNPSNNNLQLLVINGVTDTPALERYSFSESGNTLTLQRQAILDRFLYTKLTAELSPDQQNVLIYGIKQSSTLSDTIQVRNANNLEDVTFEKRYFDQTDPSDLQAYSLIGKDIYSVIINSPSSPSHQSLLQQTPASGGKVSTGSGDVAFFATCGSCNFLAAVGTGNLSQILLVTIQSGLLRSTISTPCPVAKMTLGYDGLKLAYLCSNTSLFTYDTSSEMHILQGSTYTNVTSMRLLSANYMVLVSNGNVFNIPLITSFMEDELVAERILMAVQASASPVVAISNSMGIYAFKASPQTVQIDSFNGNPVQNFSLNSGEEIKGLAFSPDNNLTITTSKATLISLTPNPCLANSTEQTGYCVCDATFMQDGLNCHCSSFMTLKDSKCVCDDSQYYVSEMECQDCSSMCHTCSGDGITGCTSYSAIFVVIIVVIFLLLAGLGILVFLKAQRSSKMDKIKSVARSRSKEQSSDLLVQEPLMKEKEYN